MMTLLQTQSLPEKKSKYFLLVLETQLRVWTLDGGAGLS